MPFDAVLTVEGWERLTVASYKVRVRVVVTRDGTEKFNSHILVIYDKALEDPMAAMGEEIVLATKAEWKRLQIVEADKANVLAALTDAETAIEGILNP